VSNVAESNCTSSGFFLSECVKVTSFKGGSVSLLYIMIWYHTWVLMKVMMNSIKSFNGSQSCG